MTKTTQGYLTFRVGPEWYGISVLSVIEVLQLVNLNQIPRSDIVGMMTLRDEVMPVIDLRQIFGFKVNYNLDTPIIAVRSDEGSYGMIVDEADDVAFISSETLTDYEDLYVRQIARLDGNILFLLDVNEMRPDGQHSHTSRGLNGNGVRKPG